MRVLAAAALLGTSCLAAPSTGDESCPASGCDASAKFGKSSWTWEDPELSPLWGTPLVDAKKNVYLPTNNGRVVKFDASGKELWTHRSPAYMGELPAGAAFVDGQVVYSTTEGFIVSVDAQTGVEKWSTRVADCINRDNPSQIYAGQGIIATAIKYPCTGKYNNNAIVAVEPKNGTNLWTHRLRIHDMGQFRAAEADGAIIVQDTAGRLSKIDVKTGQRIWLSGYDTLDRDIITPAAAVAGPNGMVYAVSNQGHHGHHGIVHAYKAADGEFVWKKTLPSTGAQTAGVGKVAGVGLAVVVSSGGGGGQPRILHNSGDWFYAYPFKFYVGLCGLVGLVLLSSLVTGKTVGGAIARMLLVAFLWTAVIVGGFVAMHFKYMNDEYKTHHPFKSVVAVFDAETGEAKWSHTLPLWAAPCPASDEELLIKRWLKTLAGQRGMGICNALNTSPPVIDADGNVIVGSQDGKLYKIRDANGDGKISGDEVHTTNMGGAFAASQAVAPGMLAAASCNGNLKVWSGPVKATA